MRYDKRKASSDMDILRLIGALILMGFEAWGTVIEGKWLEKQKKRGKK